MRELLNILSGGKTFFPESIGANQTDESRKKHMVRMMELYAGQRKDIDMLETGSFAGESAVLWCDCLTWFFHSWRLVCVDRWEPYHDASCDAKGASMDGALRSGLVYELFLHNIRVRRSTSAVIPIKGSSLDVLPLLKPESFDIIYIDGGHLYDCVHNDIKNSKTLLRNGGLICIDDVNLTWRDCDKRNCMANLDKSWVIDTKTGKGFHPGVSVAVHEHFGNLTSHDGFCVVQKVGNTWKEFVLYGDGK
jgi:predicted O-methyltransferase YrrM